MSSILTAIREKEKTKNRQETEALERKMVDVLRLAKKGGANGCTCYVCRAAEVLDLTDDWERLLEPMARIVCGVSTAFSILKKVSCDGVVGLNSASWRRHLGQLVEAGLEHECDNPMCVINDALDIIKAVSAEARIGVLATMADFLSIIDAAGEVAEITEQERIFHNLN